MRICCDTTFLIDLSRGRRKARTAYEELIAHGAKLHTTFLNVGELLAGIQAIPAERRRDFRNDMWTIIEGFSVLGVERPSVRKVAELYAALHQRLRSAGADIPASDKIIVAVGMAHDINAFLTRDVDHYKRVPGIEVILY